MFLPSTLLLFVFIPKFSLGKTSTAFVHHAPTPLVKRSVDSRISKVNIGKEDKSKYRGLPRSTALHYKEDRYDDGVTPFPQLSEMINNNKIFSFKIPKGLETAMESNVQTDPEKGISSTSEGLHSFFTWCFRTFLGFLVWSGVSYISTEFLQEFTSGVLHSNNGSNKMGVFMILASSSLSACLASNVICPFEAVRLRLVAQPGYESNFSRVMKRMIGEEGFSSLFNAVPEFLVKEIPFACANTLSTSKLFEMFPEARNDLQASLMIGLIGGTVGGIAAAVVNNPTDGTISGMKNITSQIEVVESVCKELGKKVFSTSMQVSLQFFVNDFVQGTFGIGVDDLMKH